MTFFAEVAIASFLQYYRKEFPEASITVQLEDHLLPFLRLWKGVGLASC